MSDEREGPNAEAQDSPREPSPAEGAEVAITVDRLTMGWDDFILQRDATFEVRKGEVFGLLGGSGCGKSTLLRHMIGLETPMAGEIRLAGIGKPHRFYGPPPFGVTFQSGALFGSLTVAENAALPLEQWTSLPRDAIEHLVRRRLELVNLGGYGNHLPSEISGGMKKRAAIARAIALEPEMLFLDEPSAGLDPVSAVELDELILTLSKRLGITVVIVTHELDSLFKIADRCVFLDKESKSILASGDPRVLRDESPINAVRQFFNRTTAEVT